MIGEEQQEEPLELTSEDEVTTEAETGENGTGEAAEETAEVAEEQPKKGKSVQERIDELYGRAKDAERDADYWRNRALQLEPQKAPEPEAKSSRPNPDEYDLGDADPAYWEALTDWKAEQKIEAKLKEFTEKQSVESQAKELDRTYAQNVAAVKEELPDYDEVVTKGGQRGEWPCPQAVAALIKSSPVGPKVAYHLAKNVDDARTLANLPPIQQAAAFGMIAAQFASQPEAQPKIATNSPTPPPARTKGGQFAPAGLDDRNSISAWMEARNKQARG